MSISILWEVSPWCSCCLPLFALITSVLYFDGLFGVCYDMTDRLVALYSNSLVKQARLGTWDEKTTEYILKFDIS